MHGLRHPPKAPTHKKMLSTNSIDNAQNPDYSSCDIAIDHSCCHMISPPYDGNPATLFMELRYLWVKNCRIISLRHIQSRERCSNRERKKFEAYRRLNPKAVQCPSKGRRRASGHQRGDRKGARASVSEGSKWVFVESPQPVGILNKSFRG
jgi:hypothetical protein